MDGEKKPEDIEHQTSGEMAEDFSDDAGDMGFSEDTFDEGETFDDASFEGDDMAASEFENTAGGLSDEEWDTYDEDFSEDEEFDEAPAANKSKISNKLIIGAAVIVGLGVAGYQVVSKSGQEKVIAPSTQAPPQPTPTANTEATGHYQASATTDVPESDEPEAYGVRNLYRQDFDQPVQKATEEKKKLGLLHNPDELKEIENTTLEYEYVYEDELDSSESYEETPRAQDNIPRAPLTPIPSDIATTQDTVDVIEIEETTSKAPRMPDGIENGSPFDSAIPSWEARDSGWNDTENSDQPDPPPMAAEISDQPGTTVSSTEINALGTQIDRLIARLETLEANIEDIATLEKSINRLESRMDKLEKGSKSSSSSSYSGATRSSPTSQKTVMPKASVQTPSRVRWVLKSAQPGQAMVAKQGSSDVISIATGQSLAGVGTIKSIAMENGRWVVTGTSGSIRQ